MPEAPSKGKVIGRCGRVVCPEEMGPNARRRAGPLPALLSYSAASISPVTHFPFVRVAQARKVHVDCDENTPCEAKWLVTTSEAATKWCEWIISYLYLVLSKSCSIFVHSSPVETSMKKELFFHG